MCGGLRACARVRTCVHARTYVRVRTCMHVRDPQAMPPRNTFSEHGCIAAALETRNPEPCAFDGTCGSSARAAAKDAVRAGVAAYLR